MNEMINFIKNAGRAEEKLSSVLGNELFDNLSKHNPFWDSEDEETADKLDGIRMKLIFLNEEIFDAYAFLANKEE